MAPKLGSSSLLSVPFAFTGADLACTSRDRDKRLEQVKLRITRRVFGLLCIFTANSGADLILV